MSIQHATDKKPHVCPPSTAEHPRDRWESLFIYSFICKFTNLRSKVEGLETPMDFEEAVMSNEPNDILTHLLAHFILNLKPQTRNLNMDQISTTVASVLGEFLKTSERTIFWDDKLNTNVDPFEASGGSFFATNWDFKLKILRQLVELQLVHAPSIKSTVDRAWGVVHNKHKKREITPPPDPKDPKSRDHLQMLPIGQDVLRKRYWVADDSPRIYVSTNPWKITATFETISSTREEYLTVIDQLKQNTPPEPKRNQKRSKLEHAHITLIETLEGRIEKIDAELARVARARKKIEQRRALYAQAELRETRTRRKTQKPDYVYSNGYDSEEDEDEYKYQDDMDEDDFSNGSRKRKQAPAPAPATAPTRRSGRSAVMNKPSTRDVSPADSWKSWRGERRSTRLGAPPETQLDVEPHYKRARTEDSVTSGTSMEGSSSAGANGVTNGLKLKHSGAAALKPTEVAVEQVAGKKKSKFWVYAVEPIRGAAPMEIDDSTNGTLGDHPPHSNVSDLEMNATNGTLPEDALPRHSLAKNGANGESLNRSYDIMRDSSLSPIPMDTT